MFVFMLLLILFGITLLAVCSFYFARLMGEYRGAKPFAVIEKKARAAMQAADLGVVAMIAGPVVAFFISLVSLPQIHKLEPYRGPSHDAIWVLLMSGVGGVAGVIAGVAFWTTSAILGKVRGIGKKLGTAHDPDFDGPV